MTRSMLRGRGLASLALVVIGVASPAFAAAQDAALPTAESILARVEAAIGEPAARAKAANLVKVGSLKSAMLQGEGQVEELYGATKAKTATTLPGFGTLTTGATGEWCWSADPGNGITIRAGDEQGNVLRMFAIARRAPWDSIYASAKTEARVDDGGAKCFKLAMTPKVGAKDELDHWYVDEKSAQLVRVDSSIPDPLGGDSAVVHRFADFRAVDGVVHPFVHKLTLEPMELVTTFTKITYEKELADERLAPSAEVVAAAKAAKDRGDAKKSGAANDAKTAAVMPKIPEKAGEYLLEEAKELAVASVRASVPDTEVKQNIEKMLPEAWAAVAASGATVVGPMFARFHAHESGKVDLEAGVAYSGKFVESGRVKPSLLPAGKVATTWHFGDYGGLPAARAALENWMRQQSLSKAGGPWEFFWTDRVREPDPAQWKTQILWPVK